MAPHAIIVVGVGFWGKEWIRIAGEVPDLRLAAAVARRKETHRQLAGELGISPDLLYDDYARALAEADGDIVTVVTPSETHLDIVRLALEAGKHVICEKPLADTWQAGLEIARIVKQHPNRKFMVAQTRRYVPQVETIHRFIAEGRLGRPSFITFDHRVYDTNPGWRRTLESPVLEDMSAHHFDAFRYMTGEEPLSVYAEGWNPSWSQYPVYGCHNVLVTMTDDLHVNYFGTWTTQGQQNSYDGVMKVVGEKGSLDLIDRDTLLFYPAGERPPEANPEPERIPMVDLSHREIAGVIEAFLDALDNDTTPPCDIDDNLLTFATVCAALESCRRNERLDVQKMLADANKAIGGAR